MNAGVLRIPPVAVGHHVREDPGVAGQFLVRHAGQHRDGKGDLRKRVEQLPVLDQRDAAVVQVLALEDAVGIDAAVHADHQVEGQLVLGTVLGQRPEDEMGQCPAVPLVHLAVGTQHILQSRLGTSGGHVLAVRSRAAAKSRRLVRSWRQNAETVPQSRRTRRPPNRAKCRSPAPDAPAPGSCQVEHQIVRPQAGDVDAGVEAFQRIVEVVGQKHRFQFADPQHFVGQPGSLIFC